ncbi:MAG: pyrroline-5-carboxylate reductase [Bacillota bacterium]|nr:pyrroline-5-carboxylate reductase [Bacillota bacterium]
MNYGFIGLGNMAGAIIAGMAASGKFESDTVFGYNRSEGKTLALKESCGLVPCKSAAEVVEKSDVIILAVKPQVMPKLLDEVGSLISEDKTVITIAAGKSTPWYEERLKEGVTIVRVMPNINAKVKMSVSAICGGKNAAEESIKIADDVFSTVGRVYHIDEEMFPAFSALGGASGAFVLLYIDALAEAGVRAGFPRPMAEEIAGATVVGSGLLNMESREHPIALMNKVCSPGGTTVEGVIKLKELGFETAVQQGLQAIIDKDKRL